MSKYGKAMMRRKDRVLSKVEDNISRTIIHKLSHEQYMKNRTEMYNSKDYKRLTLADKEYIRGYEDSKLESVYQNDLIYLHFIDGPNGKRMFFEDTRTVPRGIPFKSGHFWASNRNKYFSISEDINMIAILD